MHQFVCIRIQLGRNQNLNCGLSVPQLLFRLCQVQTRPLGRMPGSHAWCEKLAQLRILLHLDHAFAQMRGGAFIVGICLQLPPKSLAGRCPFLPLLAQQP